MNEWQSRGKEASPKDTIDKIEKILASCGLTASLKDNPADLEDCYSCRLTLEGPTMGVIATNGKGMTKELSHASAYGEMMERIENRMFLASPRHDDEHPEDFLIAGTPLYDPADPEMDECMYRLKSIIADTISNPPLFMSKEEFVDDLLRKIAPVQFDGKFSTTPYYSLSKNKWVYLPEWITMFTGSNGYAAGNTLAEAMVEGICEILERYSQMKIFDGDIIPPRIPMEYIDEYPHIMKVIRDIESSGRYKVRIHDCSLGIKLPVVCGIVIDTKTGKFGVKFGAQPNMAIALERVFTESMQGSNLESFTNYSNPFYTLPNGRQRSNKWNSIKISASNMPAQLLMDTPTYDFVPWEGTSGLSNKEIMWSLINLMEKMGSDIYVRDASYLGFPAVTIYATGLTEVIPVDITELKIVSLWDRVQRYFLRIDSLTDEEVGEIELLASVKKGAVLENTIGGISHLHFRKEMPGTPFEANFLEAACEYRLGKDAEALKHFGRIATYSTYMDEKQGRFVNAVFYYLQGVLTGASEENAFCVIKNLYEDVADKVRECFLDRQKVLEKLYPVCHNKPCNEVTEGNSAYIAIREFFKMLVAQENAHPADRKNLEELFARNI